MNFMVSLINSPIWELLLQAVLYFPGTFPSACALPFWARLLLLCEFSLQCLFLCVVLSFTAAHWPLQKGSCHSARLCPALHEWAHSHDGLLDSGLWHRWVGQPFIPCGTSSMGLMDLEALLDAASWAGWWNMCTLCWDGAKELGLTQFSLKVRWFYLCLSMSLLLVCKENHI